MQPLDDLPKRPESHDVGTRAVMAFAKAITDHMYFVLQGEDRHDYGTDVTIEARSANAMTNLKTCVQIKGSTATPNADGSVSVAVTRSNLNYLLAQPHSAYVCYHVPTESLLIRYAEDVFVEYEHRHESWTEQSEITVRFKETFNQERQRQLNGLMLASASTSRSMRLTSAVTPPDDVSDFIKRMPSLPSVPKDADRAGSLLHSLYANGDDVVISTLFEQFRAVLDGNPVALVTAYLAEVNLAEKGQPFDKDRIIEGIDLLEEQLGTATLHPASIQYCLGNAWAATSNLRRAVKAYNASLILSDDTTRDIEPQCCKNLGSVFDKLGNEESAKTFYERALELDPDLGEARFALSLWYHRHGDPARALQQLDGIVKRPGSAISMGPVQGWRIHMLFECGDIDGAFRDINNLIGGNHQEPWVWPWCANRVATFGRLNAQAAGRAATFWRAFLQRYPDDQLAVRERLLCHFVLRATGARTDINFEQFRDTVIALIERGGQDAAFLWDRIGHWAQYDRDWFEAEKAYRQAYELEPSQFGYCFGTALNFLNRYEEALPILVHETVKLELEPMGWFPVAVAREGLGDIDGAIDAYKEALSRDSDYDLALFNLGGLYLNTGDIPAATKIWASAINRFPEHELTDKIRSDQPALYAAITET